MKKRWKNLDKKGMSLLSMIAFVFFAFFLVLFLGIFLYGLGIFDSLMSGFDITIGGQNFTEVYQETTQQGVDAIFAVADFSAVALLLGMTIVMMLVGYFWGEEKKRLWIIMDLLIMIVSFIIAVYLQNYFLDFVISGVIDSTIYTSDIPISSGLLSRLPYLVPIMGVLIMVATYGFSKKSEGATFSDLGY